MRSLKAQFLFKPFGQHDIAKHPSRRSVEVVGLRALVGALEIRNRHIAGEREILGPEERACE